MRIALFVLLVWVFRAFAATGPDALEIAQRVADSGAYQLALNRVEQHQPRDSGEPRWAEWEALRLGLLSQLGRHLEILHHADALPPSMPVAPLRECLKLAARAAVATDQGLLARRYAARVLWQLSPPAEVSKQIRLLVIESYVADKKGDDAFRAMLKYQQDYRPLDRGTAALFVGALLDLDMPREAVSWLGSLDDDSPTKLLLRLRTGLISADAAATRARSMLAKGNRAGYWRVLLEVAAQQKDRALQIRAQEHMLHLVVAGNVQRLTAMAGRLWRTYLDTAQEIGNQNHLLMGDDASWTEFAARRLESTPEVSRAFLAYLSQRGQTRETRDNSQLRMVKSLLAGRLDLTALRLFANSHVDTAELNGQSRYLLGTIAEAHNLPEVALGYWQEMDVPPGVPEIEWRLRIAQVSIRAAGMIDRGAASLKAVIAAGGSLPVPIAEQSVNLVQELLDRGRLDVANELFEALLPKVDAAQRRKVLFGLGRIHEITGQSPVAADYYLRSALLAEGNAPDALALRSRLLAARNLARAGYKDDARMQFEWLIRNSKDAAQLEIARRELGAL